MVTNPKISVIIPVFNEIKTIKEIIKEVKEVKIPKEIIIVDDYSTDGTREFLRNLKDKDIKVIFQDKNHGKGKAIRTALNHIKGEIVIIQDADLEYNPQDYLKLINPLVKGKTEVVYGTRFPKGRKQPNISIIFLLGNKALTILTNLLYKTKLTDEATCYKIIKSKVIKSISLNCRGFEFCPEITAKLSKKGYKIIEVPIKYNPRSKKQGKKLKWKEGFKAIYTLLKYRFKD
jgi:dolichol-phosphate mannosyltransferase